MNGNWGPPMSYAANLGRDRIIAMLHELGAADVQFAFDRACLQGELDTARRLYAMGARPVPGSVMGPCETLSGTASASLLELGARIDDGTGDRLAPVGLILETYCRNPGGKARCLELVARTASTCRTRRRWPSTAAASTCWSAPPARPGPPLEDVLLTRRSTRRRWAATPTSRWRCTGRRSPARRCCTSAWTTTRSRLRAGCWSAGPTSTRGRRSTPMASADTRRSSAVWCRSR